MGALLTVNPPSEDSEFAKIIIDVNRMDKLYIDILADVCIDNPDAREIKVENFIKFMKKKSDVIFSQVAADPRIVREGYRHVVKAMHTEEQAADEATKEAEPEDGNAPAPSEETKTIMESQSAPSFRGELGSKKMSTRKLSLQHLNSEVYSDEDLFLSKDEFRVFLPTIYLFSMIWEVFIAADSSIANYLVNESEYMRAYKPMSAMAGVTFSDLLTKERWNEEFRAIDSNGNGNITFQELCNYTVKKVIAPMAYLKVVESTFFFCDLDDTPDGTDGGVPSSTTTDIPVSDYAAGYVPDGAENDQAPVEMTAELFQWGTKKKEKRCHVITARMVRKNGRRVVEFAAEINAGENELDVTLYGRKSFRVMLPNGVTATQGDFTLYPPPHLCARPSYKVQDGRINTPITRGAQAMFSAGEDPRTVLGNLTVPDLTVQIQNGRLQIPFAELPNAVYTVNVIATSYYPAQQFRFMKFDRCMHGDEETLKLMPRFYRSDLGNISAWAKTTITAPAEEVAALSEDLANMPKTLVVKVRHGAGSGPYAGKKETRCVVTAVSNNKNGKAVIDFEPQLADGIDALDVSLYGRKVFELSHPDSTERVMTGSFTLLPQQQLLPRSMYTLVDASTNHNISETGTALISAANDPRVKEDDEEVITPPGLEAQFINGVLAFPLHDLPDGVLTVTAKDVHGFFDGGAVTFVKFQQHVVAGAAESIFLDPKPPVLDLDNMMTGQSKEVAATGYAEKVLRSGAMAQKLTSEVCYTVEGNQQTDPRCELVVEAVYRNGKPTLNLQAKVKPGVEEMDFTLYGWKTFTLKTTSGQVVATGRYKLIPQASCLPRAKYNLRDCTNNKPFTGDGVVVVSASKDQRAIAGEHIMDEFEIAIKDSSFTLPVEDLPNAVLSITPKVNGYISTEFTVVKFGGHINRGEQLLFLNPIMEEEGQCRVTLAWGQAPRDLDIHVKTSDGQHVSYSRRTTTNSSVKLDIDVTSGYGPETLTFQPDPGITYRIYVKNYSKDIELYKSEAVIFFSSFNRAHDFHLRISQDAHHPSDIFWDCFQMNNEGIPTMINRVTNIEPQG